MRTIPIFLAILILLLSAGPSNSMEITHSERKRIGYDTYLVITVYAPGKRGDYDSVQCTVKNENGSAIAGGKSSILEGGGGVYNVEVKIPKAYARQELRMSCR